MDSERPLGFGLFLFILFSFLFQSVPAVTINAVVSSFAELDEFDEGRDHVDFLRKLNFFLLTGDNYFLRTKPLYQALKSKVVVKEELRKVIPLLISRVNGRKNVCLFIFLEQLQKNIMCYYQGRQKQNQQMITCYYKTEVFDEGSGLKPFDSKPEGDSFCNPKRRKKRSDNKKMGCKKCTVL